MPSTASLTYKLEKLICLIVQLSHRAYIYKLQHRIFVLIVAQISGAIIQKPYV